jgi:hypothetical protein
MQGVQLSAIKMISGLVRVLVCGSSWLKLEYGAHHMLLFKRDNTLLGAIARILEFSNTVMLSYLVSYLAFNGIWQHSQWDMIAAVPLLCLAWFKAVWMFFSVGNVALTLAIICCWRIWLALIGLVTTVGPCWSIQLIFTVCYSGVHICGWGLGNNL